MELYERAVARCRRRGVHVAAQRLPRHRDRSAARAAARVRRRRRACARANDLWSSPRELASVVRPARTRRPTPQPTGGLRRDDRRRRRRQGLPCRRHEARMRARAGAVLDAWTSWSTSCRRCRRAP